MSYCRFSSMSGRCELYVYYGYQGYSLTVAARRKVTTLPDIPEGDLEALIARNKLVQENPDLVQYVDINLPYAGKSFSFDEVQDCIAMVQELTALGYVVPPWLISVLQEECPSELE